MQYKLNKEQRKMSNTQVTWKKEMEQTHKILSCQTHKIEVNFCFANFEYEYEGTSSQLTIIIELPYCH